MCTVSIVPHTGGFTVMSNRDERRDRAVALDPGVQRIGARSIVMPIDPEGGGSWIGVNDAGLVAALLNRYDRPLPRCGIFTSRGAIVRQALGADSFQAAFESARALPATRFQPFRLLLVQRDRIAMVSSDGRELAHAEACLDRPRMFTASSLGDVFVDGPRRRLFECLMDLVDDGCRGQWLFHRHQWADKPDISVLMAGPDAATVSRTTVDVGERGIALEYESLIPGRPVQRVDLPPC